MSEAVTIKAIDQGLLDRYTGMQINVDGTPTTVEVFIEEPASEEHTERTYPSVALKLIAINPDFTITHNEDECIDEEVSFNAAPDPPERTERPAPFPFRLLYTLDTWHKTQTEESRDLVAEAILKRTHPRGFMTIPNIDAANTDLWVLWVGGVVTLDEVAVDEMILHKSLTLEVLAYLSLDSTQTVKKTATNLQLTFSNEKTRYDEDTKQQDIVPGQGVVDLTMKVKEVGEEVI